ncbi:DUF6179 domain-containing protein [Phosphitispora sp. TUW77]|uniref:DUF6179 domain-containing protein n=1 Tax=Phosphitispora sp. TUW77 TaxID=3152361 RepID=UPI003AB6C91A
MTNLDKKSLIKKEDLSKTQYFQSFLHEACRLNLVTDSELENIQMQAIQLLARQSERYTCGGSSSIKEETAQDILYSIFYTIGIYLKSLPDADMSIEALKQKPLTELYRQGKKLTELQLEHAKQMFNIVQNDSLVTDNYAYNDTILNGIPAFFCAYDVEFAAHDTPGFIDYPLSIVEMELTGIEYINEYLQKMLLENQFCKNFDINDIHCLLRGYDDNYQDLLINIFEIVLTNAIGCILAGKNILRLNIELFDRQYLQQKLVNVSKNQIETTLINACTQLCSELNIFDKSLRQIMINTIKNLSSRLENALVNNRLESLFISLKEKRLQPSFKFEDGRKMDDELFRSIADEIRRCRYVSDKIVIIKREVQSLADLVDILEGYCLFDDEFFEVFQSLEDLELALLLQRLPKNAADSQLNYTQLNYTEIEKEWHKQLNSFFKVIDVTKREQIKKLNMLNNTE